MAKAKKNNIVAYTDLLKERGINPGQTQTSNYLKNREKSTGLSAYQLWQNRIHATLRWRQRHWNGDMNWKRAYKLYGGKHWRSQDEENPSAEEARNLITVNVTMSNINNMVPYLVNNNPFFQCQPRTPMDTVIAMANQEILNYDWNLQNMTPQVKDIVLDAAIIGHGVAKTGFTFEVDQAVTKAVGNIVYEDYIKQETPFLIRTDPFAFLYDPTGTDRTLATARWAGEIFYQYYDDVVENGSYDSSVRNKIKRELPGYTPMIVSSEYEHRGEGFDWFEAWNEEDVYAPKIIRMFEVWDKRFMKYYVFADGVDEPLIEKDWPYDYLVGFPYRRLDFIRIPNSHYPVGIPYIIEDQQYELDRTRTGMFQHRRRFNRKYEISDRLNEEARRRLQEGEDGTLVPVEVVGQMIKPIEDAPLPNDYWQVEAIIKQDIMELSGMDALMRGGQLPSRTTGTEINTRVNVFRMKIDDLVDRTDRFILQLGKDILAHIQANMVKSRVIKIVGLKGEYWIRATSQDIKNEVDVHMETVAAPKVDPVLDRQQAMTLLQFAIQVAPVMAQMGQPLQIDFQEMLAWIFEKFGYKDVGRFFTRALISPKPLEESLNGNSNNLNLPPAGSTPEVPMSVADLQNQFGIASIQNAAGLQI